MLDLNFDYATCIRNSEKVSWKVDEVMPADTRLDFARPFLPDALAGTSRLAFLSADHRKQLNQITGNAYLNLFQFVEEYILAMAVKHAQAEMFGDHDAIRALVRFAEEEAKHQALFRRYREAFDRDVGKPCHVLGAAADVAGVILSKSAMAVLIVTIHLELMTMQHYTECVRDDTGIDPFFARLLKYHWLEESQHAKIDLLELEKLVAEASKEQIETAFDEYLGICDAFDGLLKAQADLDAKSFTELTGRALSDEESKALVASQHDGYRKTFLWYGMSNTGFLDYMSKLSSKGRDRVVEKAGAFGHA